MARQPRVLIADHDLDSLYYVDDLLAELDCYPIKATTADDAAEIIGAMNLEAVIINMDMIPTASEAALAIFERARDHTSVLIMSANGLQPDGASSPLRCFLEHPPEIDALRAALERCVTAPARTAR